MSYYKKRRNNNSGPVEITAKFTSVCAETGKEIKKGERCLYYPSERKVYTLDSKQAQANNEQKFDDEQHDLLGQRLGLVGMYEYRA